MRDGVGEVAERERDGVCVGEAEHDAARCLGERDAVVERRVEEADVVVERVVDGVIRAAAVLAAEAEVERGDAEVLQEGREVGA